LSSLRRSLNRSPKMSHTVSILLSAMKERTHKMYRRAPRSLVGTLVALALAAAPGASFAQNDKHDSRSNSTSTYRSDMHDWHAAGPSAGRVAVAQIFADKSFSQHDLESILPLLQDLRDAQQMCDARIDVIYTDAVTSRHSHDKMAADTRVQDCQRKLADRQNTIWSTINDRIGSDKANALRYAVEPRTEDVSRNTYTDVYLQRIDTMLVDLDKMTAARIAANGGTNVLDANGVRPASVETRTTITTTTVTPAPFYVTTPAVIDVKELVRAVQEKIVANEIGNSDYMVFIPMDRDLDTTDIRFLRESKMMMW